MRRRRFAFMLRVMAMVPPSLTTMCGHQERAREAVQPTPSAAEASKAERSAGQPIGGIVRKGGANPQPEGRIKAEVSKRKGFARSLPASAQ